MAEESGTAKTASEATKVSDWTGEYIRQIDAARFLPDSALPLWDLLLQHPLLLILSLVGTGYLVGKLLQLILQAAIGKMVKKTASSLDDQLVKLLAAPVLQTVVILSMVAAEKALSFGDRVDQFLVRTLFTLLILLWARTWFRATNLLLPALSSESGRFKVLQPRTLPLFEMGIKLGLLSVFAWFFMALWGIDGTAWLASAGVIGIAVGFAAKDTLANLISGVSIVADAPYKIGDYIVLDTGERGIVTGLGMRSTRLLTRDDVEISIPNAVMGNAKITNECGGPTVPHRIRVPVGVAYGTDTSRIVSVLEQVAQENELMLADPAPRIRMRGFGESSLDFELLGWINHPELRGRAVHELLMEIDRRFREEGIVIPFPQRDIHVRSGGLPGAGPGSA
ncbi:mechanosensitive ion channel family protein [Pseudomonadota bacterium]